MFARYAAIVKNLRGVVYIEELGSDSWKIVKWLIQRFKYRNLGLPPSIFNMYKKDLAEYLHGNPFRELVYPIPSLSGIIDLMSNKLPNELAEAIVFASLYISPLLVIGNKVHKVIRSLGVDHVYTSKDLNIKEWKLHLRIADYTVLDMYEECVMENLKAIKCINSRDVGCLANIIESRRNKVKEDKKRYWRIMSDEGRPFITYIDPLKIILDLYLNNIPIEIPEDYAAGLAIIPAVHLII